VYGPGAPRCIIGYVTQRTTKRTNINLETDLVEAASHVLGTSRTTDTVHAALREVVDRDARARLARRDFADLTPEVLDELRATRR
jgi:Arc/MetJ family transcription regulator